MYNFYLKTSCRLDFSFFAVTTKYEDNFWEVKVNFRKKQIFLVK